MSDGIDVRQYVKRGRQEWNFQMVRSYRLDIIKNVIIIFLLGLLAICIVWSFSNMTQPKMIPYMIQVDSEGNTTFKGLIQPTKLTVNDAQIKNQLIRFINDIRAVSSDMVVVKRGLYDAFLISTVSARGQLAETIDKNSPFVLVNAKKRRDVVINIIGKISEQTWRCDWFEEERTNGLLTDRKMLSGTFSYSVIPPGSEEEATDNPSSIYITEFHISDSRVTQ